MLIPRKFTFSEKKRKDTKILEKLLLILFIFVFFMVKSKLRNIALLKVLPIFSVTVMMLRDMVDSVIVLNDEHCKRNEYSCEK